MKRSSSAINVSEIGKALKRKREGLGLSLVQVAAETDVSASTLNRFETGKATSKSQSDNIAKIANWLNIPLETFMPSDGERVVCYDNQDKLEVIIGLINNDANISADDKSKLIEIFSATYHEFARFSNGK